MDWLGPLGLGPETGVFSFYMYFGLGQSEAAPKNAPPWMMDGSCMDKDTFFHWILKLGFIKLDALKKAKQGWCVHGCWVTLALGLCFLHTRTNPSYVSWTQAQEVVIKT
jgi:hypothetical protein